MRDCGDGPDSAWDADVTDVTGVTGSLGSLGSVTTPVTHHWAAAGLDTRHWTAQDCEGLSPGAWTG